MPESHTPIADPTVPPERSPDADKRRAAADITVAPQRARVRAYSLEMSLVAGLFIYAALAILAHRYAYFGWDVEVARGIQQINLPGFRQFMVSISAPGSGWAPYALVTGATLFLIAARFRTEAIILATGAGLGELVDWLLKELTDRPRPAADLVNVLKQYGGESFPSGHVFFYVNFFGFLFFLAFVHLRRSHPRSGLLVLLAAPIVLVGLSRIYMGAHWPSDVVGAYVAGGAWLVLMIEIYRRVRRL
jgi:membrane-associated phospholipid phosphatase